MATNQMKREAAKRKLVSQQARRAQQAAKRRRIAGISAAAVVAVVLIGIVALSTLGRDDPAPAAAPSPSATPAAAPAPGTCAYPAEAGAPAAQPNTPPPGQDVSSEGTVSVALTTSAGPIGLTLDRAQAPCTVNSFVSLAQQGYFDGTPCHRLTTTDGLKVLQCGDPSGTGSGGPGYTIPDEPPTTLAPAPAGGGTVTYPRGTVAMAKTDQPDSGGSQFFLVYADSTLPPDYTVFGRMDDAGLATVEKVAAAGAEEGRGSGDGKPKTPVEVQKATVGS